MTAYPQAKILILKFTALAKKLKDNHNRALYAEMKKSMFVQVEQGLETDQILLLLFANDLAVANQKMGHGFGLIHNESMLIATALVDAVIREYPVCPIPGSEEYSDIATNAVLRLMNIARGDVFSKIMIEGLLMRCGLQDELNEYMRLVYDCCLFVASLDNVKTDSEQEFLYQLAKICNIQNEAKGKTEKKPVSSKLDKLIGLEPVKKEIVSLSNLIRIQKIKKERGLRSTPMSYHCVFTGNPGTGKTTVARIVAEIYKDLGVVKKGHLVETDRSGLVADYVGQTATKTNKIIDSALDGVLFIDEAYSLAQGTEGDFGMEAISTLLKRMEDDRNRLVVILAGYTKEMKTFIDSNSGLQSRFNRYIEFPDYSQDELMDIFKLQIDQNDCYMTPSAEKKVYEYLGECVERKDKNFGNGRFVRNIVEKVLTQQANRLSEMDYIPDDDLLSIREEDVDNAIG